ncbi:kinase-like protein [Obba rivulosa]|uniref:Kinase-like protein n=1 Tax=Obba rivulosa TaxID=1052685 RepID=A0A8E2J7F0_9APHY|nr:kinase-like protein [Obba rivulosa]
MLAASTVNISYDDDDWIAPAPTSKLYRAASMGNSWGVTSIGRGFNWKKQDEETDSPLSDQPPSILAEQQMAANKETSTINSQPTWPAPPQPPPTSLLSKAGLANPPPLTTAIPVPISTSTKYINAPMTCSPTSSYPSSPRILSPAASSRPQSPATVAALAGFTPLSRSPSSPRLGGTPQRPRRRSSQQRVSLIAGRVSIIQVEPPSPPPDGGPQKFVRASSATSFLSMASDTRPPSPTSTTATERSISEFVVEREIGRGAYGLVKRAREMKDDGTLGPPLVIKQIIKSRILADCWKRHPKYGTIPIEIYVLSAISNTQYVLPPRRPWDPSRLLPDPDQSWEEGKIVNGHPNICPLLDFFEDTNYYYLVLPSTTPDPKEGEPPPPSDLFDLVEIYPNGLPPSAIRSYLGQIADAMCFLHSRGIVHRDIKDENVVLGPAGKCVLIDFGSSGLVKKGGWDTFSGTLDYAGPEILRGERYFGKEQDVWAFGVVAYVMLVGECPFTTAAEAQEGLESPFANAAIALDERCTEGKEKEGQEADGGGALGDAAALVRACLQVDVNARPTFEKILQSRFLSGRDGWGLED